MGDIVISEGEESDPGKVRAIVKMLAPSTLKQVQSFMGMANY